MTNYFSKIAAFIGVFVQSNATAIQFTAEIVEQPNLGVQPNRERTRSPEKADVENAEVQQTLNAVVAWWNELPAEKKTTIGENIVPALGEALVKDEKIDEKMEEFLNCFGPEGGVRLTEVSRAYHGLETAGQTALQEFWENEMKTSE